MPEIACFITPHGYGHASRAMAVLESLRRHVPNLSIRFFTSLPRDIFTPSRLDFRHYLLQVDIGLVQRSALEIDLDATVNALDRLLPYSPSLVQGCLQHCSGCSVVLCDIAPLGIVVAQNLGIPSVLVENFTWDWLYSPYHHSHPRLRDHGRYLRAIFNRASYRIQTEPLCNPLADSIHCGPIYRPTRGTADDLYARFCPGQRKLVVITLGGVSQNLPAISKLMTMKEYSFVFTGQKASGRIGDNVFLIGHGDTCYHPDLICAADLVVCKAGYSTIAECCQAGARVIAIGREDCAETGPLLHFIRHRLQGESIGVMDYRNGNWLGLLPDMIKRPRPQKPRQNGAEVVAALLQKLLIAGH